MKIIVMSDTHRDTKSIEKILSYDADVYFHCGDSELSFDHSLFANVIKVRGNCDGDERFPKSVCTTLGDKKICLVHGHEQDVNRSVHALFYDAQEQQADMMFFGHTHIFGAEQHEGVLFLNPGSPVAPRGGNEPTFAIIEWHEKTLVRFMNMDDKIVHEVEFE